MLNLTDAEIRAMLERAEAATTGPWERGLGNECRRVWDIHKNLIAETGMVNGSFIAAARSDVPRLATALLAERQETARLRERLAQIQEALCEIRRRVITDYFTGTANNSPRFWSCRVCTWIWKDGEAESHEPSCPLALLAPAPEAAKE